MSYTLEIYKVKPFLRWAGGKNWLIKHLINFIPQKGFNNYHEPFLGGGAVFFSLQNNNKSYLSDSNIELIETYKIIKNNVEDVILELKCYKNSEHFYYKIRNADYDSPIKRTSRFIYLNQTSYNGIYRVNLNGKYNVPFGYRNKNFLEVDTLRQASKLLGKSNLFSGDFEHSKYNIVKGNLIFLDPPYTVSHNRNSFIKYNQKLFSIEDQYRLSNLIDYIKSKEAFYILTNAAHYKIVEIFDKNDLRVELNRASLVGGKKARRGNVTEYIFTNIKH
jgi:DNA adenine methylase